MKKAMDKWKALFGGIIAAIIIVLYMLLNSGATK
jgi:uncharacterized integral membrane protein